MKVWSNSWLKNILKRFWHRFDIVYIQRWQRYRGWIEIFDRAGMKGPDWRHQAWRQSAWYDPANGRSVELIIDLTKR